MTKFYNIKLCKNSFIGCHITTVGQVEQFKQCRYLICLKTLWHMAENHLVCCESFQFSCSRVVEDYVNPSFLCCLANAVSYFQTKYFIYVRQIFGCEGEAATVNIAICS